MNLNLNGKSALVTGGGRGIGRGIALYLANMGVRVLVNDLGVGLNGTSISQSPADEVVRSIRKTGGDAVANYGDVCDYQASKEMVEQTIENFHGLDILITCAGILRDRMIFNMSESEWDEVIDIHLKGTFNLVRHACPYFREKRQGRIITITSDSGLFGNQGQANYCAAKSGILGFSKAVALEMQRFGVTCNTVAPRAATRMTLATPQFQTGITADWDLSNWNPEHIAPFIGYLASDQASAVNGQCFLVYGNTISRASNIMFTNTITKDSSKDWTTEEFQKAALPNDKDTHEQE